jgi:RimJ/RimL family protein N-acetyltransferase
MITATGPHDPPDRLLGQPSNLSGRFATLRPIEAQDYHWLHKIALSEGPITSWRCRGITHSVTGFREFIWRDTLCQFIITSRRTGVPAGLVQCIRPNFGSQYGYITMLIAPSLWQTGWPIDGLGVFIGYLFATFPFRKLYFESLDSNAQRFESAIDSLLREEARLVETEWFEGRWADVRILALYRADWDEWSERAKFSHARPAM